MIIINTKVETFRVLKTFQISPLLIYHSRMNKVIETNKIELKIGCDAFDISGNEVQEPPGLTVGIS